MLFLTVWCFFGSNAVPWNWWYAIFARRCFTSILWMVPSQILIFGLYVVPIISMKVWLNSFKCCAKRYNFVLAIWQKHLPIMAFYQGQIPLK